MNGITVSALICGGAIVLGIIGFLIFVVAGTSRRKTPEGGWAASDAPRTPQKLSPFMWVGIFFLLSAGCLALVGLIPGIREIFGF